MKKRIFNLLLLFGLGIVLASCTVEKTITYQANPDNTGGLVIKPRGGIFKGASLSINNREILNSGKNIRKITVKNIPQGDYNIHFISTDWGYTKPIDEKENISIKKSQTIERTYAIPPYNAGWWIYQGCMWGLAILPLFLLAL
jgi:hypothetical protein